MQQAAKQLDRAFVARRRCSLAATDWHLTGGVSRTRPLSRPAWVPSLLLSLGLVLLVSGCQTFRRHPVAANVATSRELTLEGVRSWQLGRIDEAEAYLRDAVKVCPDDDRARRRLADVLLEQGATKAAMQQLEEALRVAGDDPTLQVQLGELYLETGRPDSAWQLSEQALALQNELASAWALQGRILAARGELTEALAHYHRALSYDQQLPEVQLAVAELYRQQGKPLRAYATLERLSRQLPPQQQTARLFHLQGISLKELRRYRQAGERFERAIAQEPGQPAHYLQLAETQWLAGDATNAQLTLAQAQRRFPFHPQVAELQTRTSRQPPVVR